MTSTDAQDARVWALSADGWSVRGIARETGLSKSQVHRVLSANAEEFDSWEADDESAALSEASEDYVATPPFTFVGLESELVTLPGDDTARQLDMERFLDANGRSCSMLDIYRADFGDGSEDSGYLADAQRQIEAAGYRRVSDGAGRWRWER
jgi:hypothetical protein